MFTLNSCVKTSCTWKSNRGNQRRENIVTFTSQDGLTKTPSFLRKNTSRHSQQAREVDCFIGVKRAKSVHDQMTQESGLGFQGRSCLYAKYASAYQNFLPLILFFLNLTVYNTGEMENSYR